MASQTGFFGVSGKGEMAFGIEVIFDRFLARAAIDSFAVYRVHRYPVEPFGNPLPDNGHLLRLHLIQADETRTHIIQLNAVGPVRFVNHDAIAVDQIDHIGKKTVGSVGGPFEIVYEDRKFNLL